MEIEPRYSTNLVSTVPALFFVGLSLPTIQAIQHKQRPQEKQVADSKYSDDNFRVSDYLTSQRHGVRHGDSGEGRVARGAGRLGLGSWEPALGGCQWSMAETAAEIPPAGRHCCRWGGDGRMRWVESGGLTVREVMGTCPSRR